ncbi:hypothetical protein L2E82_00959 [Cichorium intybus]|uniref:Uncharacterized protein n=1 Tax=Cichorium intybus TaxID=13427 RepID=A0ACB9GYP6_CICIN|nr:hypothetical protein L2E82_00959 [Cichorium intybus]
MDACIRTPVGFTQPPDCRPIGYCQAISKELLAPCLLIHTYVATYAIIGFRQNRIPTKSRKIQVGTRILNHNGARGNPAACFPVHVRPITVVHPLLLLVRLDAPIYELACEDRALFFIDRKPARFHIPSRIELYLPLRK